MKHSAHFTQTCTSQKHQTTILTCNMLSRAFRHLLSAQYRGLKLNSHCNTHQPHHESVINAIMAIQSAKSSGSDGCPINFLKHSLCHTLWLKHQLHPCLSQVKITRNVVLNCDVMILAKVFTLRLETTMHDYHCTLRIYYYMFQTRFWMYPISFIEEIWYTFRIQIKLQ